MSLSDNIAQFLRSNPALKLNKLEEEADLPHTTLSKFLSQSLALTEANTRKLVPVLMKYGFVAQNGQAKTICIANQKGGVAKTTSCVNIAGGLADRGFKVLLIDLDPQANATATFETNNSESIYNVLKGAKMRISRIRENLYFIPSHINLAGIDFELFTLNPTGFQLTLKRALEAVKADFDFIILDTGPSLGVLNINALVAADYVVSPFTIDKYCIQGIIKFKETIEEVRFNLNPRLEFLGIFFTKYDPNLTVTRELEPLVKDHYGDKVFDSRVRMNVKLTEAPLAKMSIFEYESKSNGAKDYNKLIDEILRKSGGLSDN